MLIIWGHRVKEKSMGYAADYCPICHGITPHEIIRVDSYFHFYYIPLGKGKNLRYDGRCNECGLVHAVNPNRYSQLNDQFSGNLDALIEETFPDIRVVYADRIEQDKAIRENARYLDQESRRKLIIEPLILLNRPVEKAAHESKFDGESGLGCAFTILVPIILLLMSSSADNPANANRFLVASAIIFIMGLIYTLVMIQRYSARRWKDAVFPNLVRALRPLDPSPEEIREALTRLKKMRLKIGKKIKPEQIIDILHRAQYGRE